MSLGLKAAGASPVQPAAQPCQTSISLFQGIPISLIATCGLKVVEGEAFFACL
jgi:hypothetical protein